MEKIIFDLNFLITNLSKLSAQKNKNIIKNIKAFFIISKYNRRIGRYIRSLESYNISDLGQFATILLNYRSYSRCFINKETSDLEININPFVFEGSPKVAIQIRDKTKKANINLVSINSSYDNKNINAFVDMNEYGQNRDLNINRYRIYNDTISKSSKNIHEKIIANYFNIALIVGMESILESIKEDYYNENKNK